jgi:hypothetical protein
LVSSGRFGSDAVLQGLAARLGLYSESNFRFRCYRTPLSKNLSARTSAQSVNPKRVFVQPGTRFTRPIRTRSRVHGKHLTPDTSAAADGRRQSSITSCSASIVEPARSSFVCLSIKSAHSVSSGRERHRPAQPLRRLGDTLRYFTVTPYPPGRRRITTTASPARSRRHSRTRTAGRRSAPSPERTGRLR